METWYRQAQRLLLCSNAERYIVINDALHARDKLLVAGHELGHDRLHQRLAKVAPLKDFMLYDMTSRAEYEANVFASELLIEDEAIEECIAEEMDYFQCAAR
jgi:Zn-dependent peptidase ImmA (M78 family)